MRRRGRAHRSPRSSPSRARGSSLAEAAWEYAADPAGQRGAFRWTCQACGALISDRGPLGDHPGEVEQGHTEGCQRFAAAVRDWLALGD